MPAILKCPDLDGTAAVELVQSGASSLCPPTPPLPNKSDSLDEHNYSEIFWVTDIYSTIHSHNQPLLLYMSSNTDPCSGTVNGQGFIKARPDRKVNEEE